MKITFPTPDKNLAGQLLLAGPQLVGTDFAQSVLYLCTHSAKEGALGVVVNRPLEVPSMEDIWEQLDLASPPSKQRLPLGWGGPVEPGRGFILHSSEWEGQGEVARPGGVASLNAGLEILRDIAGEQTRHAPRHALMLLGHAGWGPGQLEAELFRENVWYLAPATEELLFHVHPAERWATAFEMMGIIPSMLSPVTGEG